ncbi:hypothetical protein CTAYLR_009396 [Chrysophaeum taylorii]|uniref:Ferredoxin--nitrite reductase, chloroplastic n=1 Tax=Chrysophaeum taylorii TaxID=2483200 RepID=A0AAD7XPE7_9STRA|nr:hypothetical protein CTAYLR_009396 [Chrysophaeum taylorii]
MRRFVSVVVVAVTSGLEIPVVSRRTGISYLPSSAVSRAKAGNKIEKTKLAKDPTNAWSDLHAYAAAIRSGELSIEEVEAGDANIRLKWAGLLSRFKKTPGKFMMRLRTPNGIVCAKTLRAYADAIEPHGGVMDITTRQNVQLRRLPLEAAADLVRELHSNHNATSFQSAMDNVRNVVGSPLGEHDLVDTRPFCNALNDLVSLNPETGERGNPRWGNLPRKFNIAVSGGRDDFAHARINDIGLEPVPRGDEMGFNVVVGGYFSIKRVASAVDLDLWIPADVNVVLDLCSAILEIFRDEGARGDRQKARLMWLVEEYGIPAFRARVLEKAEGLPHDAAQRWEDDYGSRRELLGIHPTHVGVHVPVGRLSVDEMRLLADLADDHSNGELRLTVEQNVLFPNVKSPDALVRRLTDRLAVDPGHIKGHTVSCTGAQFCPLAIIETKHLAERVSARLDDLVSTDRPVRIHYTGCPNSCGQVQLADIGLMGAPARRLDPISGKTKAVPGVNVYLGGDVGESFTLVTEPVLKGIPIDDEDDLVDKLADLVVEHFQGVRRHH